MWIKVPNFHVGNGRATVQFQKELWTRARSPRGVDSLLISHRRVHYQYRWTDVILHAYTYVHALVGYDCSDRPTHTVN